jgi:hypothetical protein
MTGVGTISGSGSGVATGTGSEIGGNGDAGIGSGVGSDETGAGDGSGCVHMTGTTVAGRSRSTLADVYLAATVSDGRLVLEIFCDAFGGPAAVAHCPHHE